MTMEQRTGNAYDAVSTFRNFTDEERGNMALTTVDDRIDNDMVTRRGHNAGTRFNRDGYYSMDLFNGSYAMLGIDKGAPST